MKNKNKKKEPSKFIKINPLSKSFEPALFYGFTSISTPRINKEDTLKANELKESWLRNPADLPWVFTQDFAEERSAMFRKYIDENMMAIPQPVMLAYESSHGNTKNKKSVNLEILGSTKSIAEALLLKTAISILKDNGYKNLQIKVNSIGDKESYNKYAKELIAFYRKNLNSLTPHCRQNFKKDPLYVVACKNKSCSCHRDDAPSSICSLSDESRQHFKEVLEYIETMEVPYNIDNTLVSDRRFCSQTVIEIINKREDGKEELVANAFRFDCLAQKFGNKKDIPGIVMKVFVDKDKKNTQIKKVKRPNIFLLQISDDAKHKSLEILEILRKENIPVYHMLGRDKFGSQFALVEKLGLPYVIILGKKEAIENTAIVRNNSTRFQETVPVPKLAEYIENLK